jgi:glycosyltransferase involved in cell wall biosynthesis
MAQAIAHLVRDESLRLKLRENGLRESQERWRFDAYVDRLLDFYERVCERYHQS